MDFTQLLITPANIRQGVICSSKKRTLEMIGRLMAERLGLESFDEHQCFESLFERERLANTALGNGIAMPRARLPMGDKPIALFLQLEAPIDYEAPDKREVDLILAIMIPNILCLSYTHILADLAKKLTKKSLCKQLRAAKSADEIWHIFEYTDHHVDDHDVESD